MNNNVWTVVSPHMLISMRPLKDVAVVVYMLTISIRNCIHQTIHISNSNKHASFYMVYKLKFWLNFGYNKTGPSGKNELTVSLSHKTFNPLKVMLTFARLSLLLYAGILLRLLDLLQSEGESCKSCMITKPTQQVVRA